MSVTRGLGQPEQVLVTGGLGAPDGAPEGVMAAVLTAGATVTATLTTDAAEPQPAVTGGAPWAIPIRLEHYTVDLAATITAAATVTATAEIIDYSPVYDWNNALILELV